MSRREIREQIFQILFAAQFYDTEEREEQVRICMEELGTAGDEEASYIHAKVCDILRFQEEIDSLIDAKADRWRTARMARAELCILRLAVYEMRYEDEIPVSVAINEAVELAKRYGAENGAGFVNGVLSRLV